MKQCQGITRVGKRCTITACSKLANDGGRLASGPLLRGGDYCLFHAKPFCTRPVDLEESPCYLVVMLDLETTGTDISNDRIVEFAASQCPADSRFFGGAFSTVVHVEPGDLETRGDAATSVHGISNEEIAMGIPFTRTRKMFREWLADLQNAAIIEMSSDSEEENGLLRLAPEPPRILLAGHNALKFDFPLLLAECLRHGLDCDCFSAWLFADTLPILRSVGGCAKLQCLIRGLVEAGTLRGHRALDDCVALRKVIEARAEQLDVNLPTLLRTHAVRVDLPSSLAQLHTLME